MTPDSPPPAAASRGKQLAILGLVVAVLAVVGWRLWVHGVALTHYRNGKALLDRDRPDAARGEFDRALAAWPTSGETHFLAARAARRSGDLDAARRHLGEAGSNGWSAADVGLERELIAAQSGGFDDVEQVLRRYVTDGHPDSADVLEVLTAMYYSRYRLVDAARCAAQWVERRPLSAKAWNYQGQIYERLQAYDRAIESFREAVRLDPEYRPARINLISSLQHARQSAEEIGALLEPLVRESPGDEAVLRLVVRYREAQGRIDDALAAAEDLHKRDPQSAYALAACGRLELDRGRPTAAAPYLRRAVERAPYDPDALYTLLRCLNEVGPPEEAKATAERLERVRADLKRLQTLAGQIVRDPANPDLRREAGEVCLRNGLEQEGVGWLVSALKARPDHAPTHALLADYYARTNRPDLADYHRSKATPAGPMPAAVKPAPTRS